MEKGRAVQDLWNRTQGNKLSDAERDEQRRTVVTPYEERLAQAVKRIEDNYRRRKTEQRRLGLTLARLSPAGAFTNFVTEMADTGMRSSTRTGRGAPAPSIFEFPPMPLGQAFQQGLLVDFTILTVTCAGLFIGAVFAFLKTDPR